MDGWYQTYLVDTGRSAALWVLIGFVVTYASTRWITLRICARQARSAGPDGSAIKDVYIGGVHIHHQVWGILLVLVVGLLLRRDGGMAGGPGTVTRRPPRATAPAW
jgi:hypothetical protein